jgi:multidrug efflux pump subunit AcrA (membrane-fusion protein)
MQQMIFLRFFVSSSVTRLTVRRIATLDSEANMTVRILVFVAAVFGFFCGQPLSAQEKIATVESVILKTVETAEVPAEFAGILSDVVVGEGKIVREGDLLAKIKDIEVRMKLAQAELEMEKADLVAKNDLNVRFAEKAYEVAESDLSRAKQANQIVKDSVSGSELEKLQLLVEKAKLDIDREKRNIDQAVLSKRIKDQEIAMLKDQIARHEIRAPISGMVIAVDKHRGEWVKPEANVVKIVLVDRLRAEGLVSADHAVQGIENKRVVLSITIPGSGQTEFAGRVTFVHPDVNTVNGQVKFWADIENSGLKLRPGLQGKLTIYAEDAKPAEPDPDTQATINDRLTPDSEPNNQQLRAKSKVEYEPVQRKTSAASKERSASKISK